MNRTDVKVILGQQYHFKTEIRQIAKMCRKSVPEHKYSRFFKFCKNPRSIEIACKSQKSDDHQIFKNRSLLGIYMEREFLKIRKIFSKMCQNAFLRGV